LLTNKKIILILCTRWLAR